MNQYNDWYEYRKFIADPVDDDGSVLSKIIKSVIFVVLVLIACFVVLAVFASNKLN
jgi:hypothetical protein